MAFLAPPAPPTCAATPPRPPSQEPSAALPPTPLPPALTRSTIYHLLPHPLPNLPPPAHPADSDTLALAVSLHARPWLRARYIRTRAFLRHTRSKRRVFRGPHGTPAGALARTQRLPLALLPTRRWLLAYGRGLPYRLSPRDLVTYGETALGDVLTEGESADRRGTEIADGATFGARRYVLSRARRPGGGVRSFVVTTAPTRRVACVDAFEALEIAVCEAGVVVVGRPAGALTRFFGGAARSEVVVLSADGGVVSRGSVAGVLSDVSASVEPGGVVVRGRLVEGEAGQTTLADIRSGDEFLRRGGVRTSVVGYNTATGETRRLGVPDVRVLQVATPSDAGTPHEPVYIGYNPASDRFGVWALDGECWEADPGDRLSGAVYSPPHTHLSALLTNPKAAKLLFFEPAALRAGPVAEVPLHGLGGLNTSIGAVWTDWDFEWGEDTAKIVKSAYELFADKEWNDIDSGFSSLGLRL